MIKNLSPSRASQFKTCPKQFKFANVDKLKEPTNEVQAKGTTVHQALEDLFDLPKEDRNIEKLHNLFREAWTKVRGTDEHHDLFSTVEEEREWGVDGLKLLNNYMTIEDPASFDPLERERWVRGSIEDLNLRVKQIEEDIIREKALSNNSLNIEDNEDSSKIKNTKQIEHYLTFNKLKSKLENQDKFIAKNNFISRLSFSVITKQFSRFEFFPDNIIRDLMNSVELDLIAMAMKGMDEEVITRVKNNLPQKKQAMYEPVEGAVSKREVDNARKGIVQAAKQMEKDGAFKLEDFIGGGEMVE